MESYITALEQLTRTLSGVDDAEGAEAARDEVLRNLDEMREILEVLGTASEDLKNAYGVRYLDAALKYQDQKRRIEADPDLGAVLARPLAALPGPQ